jgi:hypothetical protein
MIPRAISIFIVEDDTPYCKGTRNVTKLSQLPLYFAHPVQNFDSKNENDGFFSVFAPPRRPL